MSTSSYQVIFTGVLRRGVSRREGISQLAQRLGLDFDQIKRLLAAARPVVKRCSEQSEGERLVHAFWQAGWQTELMCNGQLLFDGDSRYSPSAEAGVAEVKTKALFSEDRGCSVQVPESWQSFKDLNRSAVIQSGSLEENQFLVVLSQQREDLPAASTIGAYCGAQLKQCADRLSDSSILIPATPLEEGIFCGYFGEITAKIDAVPVQYLVVCFECGTQIYTLFLWCEEQDYRCRKQNFERIAFSFRAEAVPVPTGVDRDCAARQGMLSIA
ncbi:hypothetical protein GNX18_12245 [Microbulbifer sp. SH-1]|uniref:hypothetical protein n=1 Tax=Microbulbifer sp. SH-1 TaxID=2681547 RepID=UPI00140940CC|nr:hypothetical protein [Microbulbifer sp. SH-1]QIL90438.1 hypothetical protein GNX18_12245 [Microbulbifer sp. SH-1]